MRMRAWGGALLASLGFSICLAVTLAGGIGTIAAGSDKSLARRENASATYADRRKELESLRVKRADLPTSRPAGTIEGDMTAARVDRRWSTSNSCTDATASASRTFCAEYARLQGELATAKEAVVLDEKIRELTQKRMEGRSAAMRLPVTSPDGSRRSGASTPRANQLPVARLRRGVKR